MRKILSGLLVVAAVLPGAWASVFGAAGTATPESGGIDRLLALSASPDAELENLSVLLDLARKTRDESTVSVGAIYWIPARDPSSGIARVRVGIRPGTDERLATVRIVIGEDGPCLVAHDFARRHRLMPSPPPHPWGLSEADLRSVRYVGWQGAAQVFATASSLSGCVEEIVVWHRPRRPEIHRVPHTEPPTTSSTDYRHIHYMEVSTSILPWSNSRPFRTSKPPSASSSAS